MYVVQYACDCQRERVWSASFVCCMDSFCCLLDDGRHMLLLLVIFWACEGPKEKESHSLGAIDPDVRFRQSRVKVPFTFDKPHTPRFVKAQCEKGRLSLRETGKELEYYFSIPEYESCTLSAYSKELLTFSWKDKIHCESLGLRELSCEAKPQKK